MSKKWWGLLFSVTAVLFYQNCGNIALSPVEHVHMASVQEKVNYCSDPGFGASDAVNIIFVVDMSESNLVLGLNGTMVEGTDQTGKRFKAIRDFMGADCVRAKPLSKFAVVGFSSNLLVQGGQACGANLLKSAAGANNDLSYLENIQTTDKPTVLAGGQSASMQSTHYLKGLDCAKSSILAHFQGLTNEEKRTNAYMVYFMTDGLPNDSGVGSSTNQTYRNQVASVIDSIMALDTTSAGARLSPIFYGENKLPSTDVPKARDIIDFMAMHGNSIRTSVDDASSVQFCQLLNSGTRSRYTVKKFGVANLTAKMVRGRLMADSDMDGLADDEEMRLGFNPVNPRSGVSAKILDGLCPAGMSADQCTAYDGIDCGPIGQLLLNKCDRGAQSMTDGVDTDRDLIPDVIEVLKGTRPNFAERPDDNPEPDNMTTLREIDLGRDPFYPDDSVNSNLLLNYVNMVGTTTSNCGPNQESWSVDLVNAPLVATKEVALTNFEGGENVALVNHQQDENILLVYYIVEKETQDPLRPTASRLFGQYLKVNYRNPAIRWGVFKQLGVIDGQGPN